MYMNVSFATALKFLSSTTAAPETILHKQKREKQAELSGMKLLSCSSANENVNPSQNVQ